MNSLRLCGGSATTTATLATNRISMRLSLRSTGTSSCGRYGPWHAASIAARGGHRMPGRVTKARLSGVSHTYWFQPGGGWDLRDQGAIPFAPEGGMLHATLRAVAGRDRPRGRFGAELSRDGLGRDPRQADDHGHTSE